LSCRYCHVLANTITKHFVKDRDKGCLGDPGPYTGKGPLAKWMTRKGKEAIVQVYAAKLNN